MPILLIGYVMLAIGFGVDAVLDSTNRRPATLLATMFGGMALFMHYTNPAT